MSLRKILPPSIKRLYHAIRSKITLLQIRVTRVINQTRTKKNKIICSHPITVISDRFNATCGYYDFNPIKDNMLLYACENRRMSKASVMLFSLADNRKVSLWKSNIANTQQSNRLRWINDEEIIFNDFIDKSYCSILFNTRKKTHRLLNKPIYDVKDEEAATLDFNRLGRLRPGYGYSKLKFSKRISGDDVAITVFSIHSGAIINEIKYRDITKVVETTTDLSNCYINHICYSPRQGLFSFFFVEVKDSFHKCSLCVYNQGRIVALETNLSVSHYTWKNDKELLVTAYDSDMHCAYYTYDLTGRRTTIMADILTYDGHPTFIDDTRFITDTYPDRNGYQKILLVDTNKLLIHEIAEAYSTAKHLGVRRCDLHPRYDEHNGYIVFDADIDGHRRVYCFQLEE